MVFDKSRSLYHQKEISYPALQFLVTGKPALKELQSTEGLDMFLIFAIMFVNEYRAPAFSWIHFRFVFELTIA